MRSSLSVIVLSRSLISFSFDSLSFMSPTIRSSFVRFFSSSFFTASCFFCISRFRSSWCFRWMPAWPRRRTFSSFSCASFCSYISFSSSISRSASCSSCARVSWCVLKAASFSRMMRSWESRFWRWTFSKSSRIWSMTVECSASMAACCTSHSCFSRSRSWASFWYLCTSISIFCWKDCSRSCVALPCCSSSSRMLSSYSTSISFFSSRRTSNLRRSVSISSLYFSWSSAIFSLW
mmetsp:Transcript_77513/g.203501  ORF Transcript_77513/g.203501 Transcript_77513/m.203501 type:complete len:235 (+) Transcript_77513:904-1608(+)